jgi:hypothetical protein
MGEQKPLLASGKEDELEHLRRLKAYQPYVKLLHLIYLRRGCLKEKMSTPT